MAVKGKTYRVKSDTFDIFKSGDLVVALENDSLPWCVKKNEYTEEDKRLSDNIDDISATRMPDNWNILADEELEEVAE